MSNKLMLPKESIRFIMAAASKDETRRHLMEAFATVVNGDTWLACTDGHRAHAVRAFHKPPKTGHVLISPRGYVASVEHEALPQPPPLANIWSDDNPHKFEIETERLWALASGRHERLCIEFSAECGAKPRTFYYSDTASKEATYVRMHYVRDALLCIGMRSKHRRTVFDHEAIRVEHGGPLDPVVLAPRLVDAKQRDGWRAILMPMRAT